MKRNKAISLVILGICEIVIANIFKEPNGGMAWAGAAIAIVGIFNL